MDKTNVLGVPPGESQTVLFKPCSGIFNQEKMLPIRYMPLTIELELVNDSNEPIVSDTTTGSNASHPFAHTQAFKHATEGFPGLL